MCVVGRSSANVGSGVKARNYVIRRSFDVWRRFHAGIAPLCRESKVLSGDRMQNLRKTKIPVVYNKTWLLLKGKILKTNSCDTLARYVE